MDAISSSETSADFQRTTRRYTPEDGTIHARITFYAFENTKEKKSRRLLQGTNPGFAYWAKVNYANPQSEQSVSLPRFEQSTSGLGLQVRSLTVSANLLAL
jgi:hypothetical protein